MSGHRVVVIGLDSLEPSLAMRYMPRFTYKMSMSFDMLSTLPPDSAIAWPVAYTGLGLHSLLKTTPFNVEEYKLESSPCLESSLAKRILGKAYWDRLGQENYKVCLLFPYPLNTIVSEMDYHINGMAVFLTENDELRFFSQEEEEIVRAIIDTWKKKGHRRERKNKGFYERFKYDMELFTTKTEILYQILEKDAFDLIYFYSDILEWLHRFWNTPKYPYLIYKRVEDFLLNLIDSWGDRCLFIIHTDHGIGSRPRHLLNIAKVASGVLPRKSITIGNIARDFGLRFLLPEISCRLGLEESVMYNIYPRIKEKLNLRYTTDFLEIIDEAQKANSQLFYDPSYELRDFCGFYIKDEKALQKLLVALNPYIERLYNGFRDSRLREIMVPTSNIAMKLKDYCTFRNHFAPTVIRNPKSKFLPGTHAFKTKLYVFSGPYEIKKLLENETALLTDIAPTILGLFGIRQETISGYPLFRVRERQ